MRSGPVMEAMELKRLGLATKRVMIVAQPHA